MMQRHAAATWDEGGDFRELVKADPDVHAHLEAGQLAELFDYGYYTANVDALFERAGLAANADSIRERDHATA